MSQVLPKVSPNLWNGDKTEATPPLQIPLQQAEHCASRQSLNSPKPWVHRIRNKHYIGLKGRQQNHIRWGDTKKTDYILSQSSCIYVSCSLCYLISISSYTKKIFCSLAFVSLGLKFFLYIYICIHIILCRTIDILFKIFTFVLAFQHMNLTDCSFDY